MLRSVLSCFLPVLCCSAMLFTLCKYSALVQCYALLLSAFGSVLCSAFICFWFSVMLYFYLLLVVLCSACISIWFRVMLHFYLLLFVLCSACISIWFSVVLYFYLLLVQYYALLLSAFGSVLCSAFIYFWFSVMLCFYLLLV